GHAGHNRGVGRVVRPDRDAFRAFRRVLPILAGSRRVWESKELHTAPETEPVHAVASAGRLAANSRPSSRAFESPSSKPVRISVASALGRARHWRIRAIASQLWPVRQNAWPTAKCS